MTNPMQRLASMRSSADQASTARENCARYIADRRACGWSQADVDEYVAAIKVDMADPERAAAAREFWAVKCAELDVLKNLPVNSHLYASNTQ